VLTKIGEQNNKSSSGDEILEIQNAKVEANEKKSMSFSPSAKTNAENENSKSG
jgi:hypothetical protein